MSVLEVLVKVWKLHEWAECANVIFTGTCLEQRAWYLQEREQSVPWSQLRLSAQNLTY